MKTKLVFLLVVLGIESSSGQPPIHFRVQKVSTELFEAVGAFEVNNDGKIDLVSGGYWYEGPSFINKHFIGEPKRYGEYFDDFSTLPMDVNGDGFIDFITGGWWGNNLRWKQNPGTEKTEWKEHIIGETGNVETTRAWDVDGDGTPEIVPNNPNKLFRFFRLNKNASGQGNGTFTEYTFPEAKQGHGLGFGDVNGDGRGDFIMADGWLEAPTKPFIDKWVWHSDLNLGTASIPILVKDLNEDGRADLIVGQAHNYGLDWYEQLPNKQWKKHAIDQNNSQFHEMVWADLYGNGKPVIVTGKRFRAHNDNDPGSHDDYGLYYYQWNGDGFSKQIISYGTVQGKGTGIQLSVSDLNADGRVDIAVAGKDGLYIYFNEGIEP